MKTWTLRVIRLHTTVLQIIMEITFCDFISNDIQVIIRGCEAEMMLNWECDGKLYKWASLFQFLKYFIYLRNWIKD